MLISTHFAYHFSQFYSQRVQKPLQWALSAVFCTNFHLIHHFTLVWTHKTTNFLSKNYFTAGQRVVSRPPRPIAGMAPDHWHNGLVGQFMLILFTIFRSLWEPANRQTKSSRFVTIDKKTILFTMKCIFSYRMHMILHTESKTKKISSHG